MDWKARSGKEMLRLHFSLAKQHIPAFGCKNIAVKAGFFIALLCANRIYNFCRVWYNNLTIKGTDCANRFKRFLKCGEKMKKIVTGILAHVDSGKTTLSEAMLYLSGSISKLGRVDHGDSFLDNFSLGSFPSRRS